MNRPPLCKTLSATEFGRWYWLKAELVTFCREQHLPVTGAKQLLVARIEAFLSGRESPAESRPRSPSALMPTSLNLTSVIAPGWRCSQALREFFVAHVGPGFRFNAAIRDFIHRQHGRTLAEAIDHYRHSLTAPKDQIADQFQYNRHMRAFHQANPGASQAEAVAAWWAKRGQPEG
jgi:hypothetical protein